MADRQIYELDADATPARTEVLPKQDAIGAIEAQKSTIAQILALAVAADISDASANGRSLITAADYAAMRTLLGLVIGTNVQAQDAELAAIAGLTSAADRLPYFTGSGTASLATFTAAGRAIVDDADAAAQRTTLGLGTLATASTVATTDISDAGTTGAALVQAETQEDALATIGVNALFGQPDGIATLDGDGIVDSSQLPNFVNSGGFVLNTTVLTTNTTLDSASIGETRIFSGSGITVDFDLTGFTIGDAVELQNISQTSDLTVSNGTSGINVAGLDTFLVPPNDRVKITYRQASDPQLIASRINQGVDVSANGYLRRNTGDTAFEAVDDERPFGVSVAAASGETLAATGAITFLAPSYPVTLSAVRRVSVGDTVSIQLYETNSTINGFGSPVAVTTTVGDTASTEAIAAGAVMRMEWSSGGASLTGIAVTLVGVRTGA